MTKQYARTPRSASRRRAAVDRALDADFFKALADPTRLKLLTCLIKCGRPCTVSEIAECCAVDFSVVARHLAHLARAELLDARKDGRSMLYTARCIDLHDRLLGLADAIEEWCPTGGGVDPCCDSGGKGCCAS